MVERTAAQQPTPIVASDYRPPAAAQPRQNAKAGVTANSHATVVLPWWRSQYNLMLLIFAMLVIIAILGVRLAPPPEANIENALGLSPTNNSTGVAKPQSPWSTSQQTKARADSQVILQQLLQLQQDLEDKRVENWANTEFQQALQSAADGDVEYRQGEYPSAVGRYQTALEQMQALQNSIAPRVRNHIESGLLAINTGKAGFAIEEFEAALALQPQSQQAQAGLRRASQLAPLLQLLIEAQALHEQYQQTAQLADLQSAEQRYQQVLEVDPELLAAQSGLQRVQVEIAERMYKQAMSKGYRALFAGQHSRARQAFTEALQFKANDAMALSAQRQSLASKKSTSLNELLGTAKRYEASEDWQSALLNYQAALRRDGSQLAAKMGEIRSSARNQLNSKIQALLADPLALSSTAKEQAAKKVLTDAKAINNGGKLLTAQIAKIERALASMQLPIKVQFISNTATQVSLTKQGTKKLELGTFSKKDLILKPGRYVAIGKRRGFHDVRIEIELSAAESTSRAAPGISFAVSCEQPINPTLSSS